MPRSTSTLPHSSVPTRRPSASSAEVDPAIAVNPSRAVPLALAVSLSSIELLIPSGGRPRGASSGACCRSRRLRRSGVHRAGTAEQAAIPAGRAGFHALLNGSVREQVAAALSEADLLDLLTFPPALLGIRVLRHHYGRGTNTNRTRGRSDSENDDEQYTPGYCSARYRRHRARVYSTGRGRGKRRCRYQTATVRSAGTRAGTSPCASAWP